MGNQNEKMPKRSIVNHSRIYQSSLVQNDELLRIQIPTDSQFQVQQWQSSLPRCSAFNKVPLFLPKFAQHSKKQFCGNSGILTLYFQAYPYVFQDEIENRFRLKKHFQEQQLWYLLYSLAMAASDFSRVESKVGDIRPKNILINQKGQIKVISILSWPSQYTNYQKTIMDDQLTYLSPEQMALIKLKHTLNSTNIILSQSFSIGITLLETALIEDCSGLYDVEKGIFYDNKLQTMLYDLDNLWFIRDSDGKRVSYSAQLKQAIKHLCEINPFYRLSSIQLLSKLKPFETNIIELLPSNNWKHLAFKLENKNKQIITLKPIQSQFRPIEPVHNKIDNRKILFNNNIPTTNSMVYQGTFHQPPHGVLTQKIYNHNQPKHYNHFQYPFIINANHAISERCSKPPSPKKSKQVSHQSYYAGQKSVRTTSKLTNNPNYQDIHKIEQQIKLSQKQTPY